MIDKCAFLSRLTLMLGTVVLLFTNAGCGSDDQTDPSPSAVSNPFPSLTWNLSLWGKPRAGTETVEALARELSKATNGAWVLKLHYGEALSKARENLDGLAIGAFEAALFCNFYHPQKTPALMVLTMPFLPMANWEDNRKVREAVYAHPAVVDEVEKWGARIYTSTFLPQYEFMGRGKPPLELYDWRGMTIRAGGGIGDAMLKLGATPTSSTATEVYTGVQQGTMDAASFPFTYGHVSYRIHEVSTWYTSNLAPGSADCTLAFSRKAHDALPAMYKQLLEDVKDSVIEAQIQAYIDVDKTNLPLLSSSLQEIRYSPEQRNVLKAVAGKPVLEDWIAENQDRFDARGLVETIYAAVGETFD